MKKVSKTKRKWERSLSCRLFANRISDKKQHRSWKWFQNQSEPKSIKFLSPNIKRVLKLSWFLALLGSSEWSKIAAKDLHRGFVYIFCEENWILVQLFCARFHFDYNLIEIKNCIRFETDYQVILYSIIVRDWIINRLWSERRKWKLRKARPFQTTTSTTKRTRNYASL